jgi:hypothetical protein
MFSTTSGDTKALMGILRNEEELFEVMNYCCNKSVQRSSIAKVSNVYIAKVYNASIIKYFTMILLQKYLTFFRCKSLQSSCCKVYSDSAKNVYNFLSVIKCTTFLIQKSLQRSRLPKYLMFLLHFVC